MVRSAAIAGAACVHLAACRAFEPRGPAGAASSVATLALRDARLAAGASAWGRSGIQRGAI